MARKPSLAGPDDLNSTARDPYAALRVRNYRLFVLGWFVTLMGTQAQSVAIGWEIYLRTEKPISLGLVGLAHVVPLLVLALPAGHLPDT